MAYGALETAYEYMFGPVSIIFIIGQGSAVKQCSQELDERSASAVA